MTWIRASFARIHGSTDCATEPEAHAHEALAGIPLEWLQVDTRQRRRVSTQIRRLARVFEITFARIHIARWPEFLLQSLSIPRVAVVNVGATRRWIRAATLSTLRWTDEIDALVLVLIWL